MPFSLSMPVRTPGSTLSKPSLMSRRRVEALSFSLCAVATSWVRAAAVWNELTPGREPHWFGCSRPSSLACRQAVC